MDNKIPRNWCQAYFLLSLIIEKWLSRLQETVPIGRLKVPTYLPRQLSSAETDNLYATLQYVIIHLDIDMLAKKMNVQEIGICFNATHAHARK